MTRQEVMDILDKYASEYFQLLQRTSLNNREICERKRDEAADHLLELNRLGRIEELEGLREAATFPNSHERKHIDIRLAQLTKNSEGE